jgi:glycosyltransferase involved in cell wall biosynthesis
MLIGLDAIPLTEPRAGVGHSTLELARALARVSPADEFELIYPSSFDVPEAVEGACESPSGLPANLRVVRVEVGAAGRRWWSWGLPRHLARARRRYDLFHGTNFEVPLWGGVPSVVTVHDLSALLHPSTHTARTTFRARRRLPLMVRRAAACVTPTESVRREVCERLRLEASKVFAVPEAARAVFRPASDEEVEGVRRASGLAGEFLLAVGTIEPRKNLTTLLRAFESLARERPSSDLRLVVAGRRGWLDRAFLSEVERSTARGRVLLTGYVSDETLRALYTSCRAFVYPSVYEGFGLPPLEAMACGAAVVAGDIPAVAEVTGGAALLVPPRDADALARAIASLLDDPDARARLTKAGRARASEFTWERAARMTLEVYGRVLK